MNKIFLSIIFGLIVTLNSLASHIVGGELFMFYKSDYNYNIGLKLYFDDINGEKDILKNENIIVVNIYRKSDNVLIDTIHIPETQNYLITYNNPVCARVNDIQTRLILYKKDFNFNPDIYNDPGGYYMVWERCCRNKTITNLSIPDKQGNVFYMEFPAVTKGTKIIDSSPGFADIKGDYACVNQPFLFDFSATDADGDQLKYFINAPLNTASTDPGGVQQKSDGTFFLTNINSPAPYSEVIWANGYDLNHIIQVSSPSQQMEIDEKTGKISFTSNQLGLFVFSIRCEEWRNNVKIGEVHRDFQIKVLDCQLNQPPSGFIKDNKNIKVTKNGLIIIKATDSRCFNVLQSDNFTNTVETTSNLTIKLLQTDFDISWASLSPLSGIVTINNDTTISQLCWRNCAKSPPGHPFHAVLVVSDQGCPFPKTDTIQAQFEMDSLPNIPSVLTTTLPNSKDSVIAGNNLTFNVSGTNPDHDLVTLEALGKGFNLADIGMNFNSVSSTDSLFSVFTWMPDCSVPINKDFLIDFILKEHRCGNVITHVKTVLLKFKPRPGSNPTIALLDSIGNMQTKKYYVEKFIGDSIRFQIVGRDQDNTDPIKIHAIPHDFKLTEEGMQYDNPKVGLGSLKIPFSWKITCDKLDMVKDNNFIIDFVIEDNSCRPERFDTITTTLHIKDHKANYDFIPFNVFTPNGDQWNEYFTMPNLPADNCLDRFDRIEIYNRWGKEVFKSNDRNFKWKGEDFSSGTYYYLIYYKIRKYRGWVGLLK